MLRVLIVHYGESSPVDVGYRPLRYGQLAQRLSSRGHEVVRLLPAHPHLSLSRRQPEISDSQEGRIVHLDTPAYATSRGLDRIRFLRDFGRSARNYCEQSPPFDVAVVGFPPGLSKLASSLSTAGCVVVRDIRDVWPDAQVATLTGLRKRIGGVVAPLIRMVVRRPLDRAHFVTSVSEEYMAWATRGVPRLDALVVPIGSLPASPILAPYDNRSWRVTFVGSINTHFDFGALANAWRIVPTLLDVAPPTLTIAGDGASLASVRAMFAGARNVEFMGRIPSSSVAELLSDSLVGLAPYHASASMTSTNKMAEYLSAGLPVITTIQSNLVAELVRRDVADFVDSADPVRYAKAIVGRLARSSDQELQRTFSVFTETLEASTVADRFCAALESLVGNEG